MIPLVKRLKKERHREIARAQDLVIEELYRTFEKAVLHGGTSIWRCYKGNRFSEDIDVYLQRDINKIRTFFEKLREKDFIVVKKKISDRSIFSDLQFNKTSVRFEATFRKFRKIRGVLGEYETSEGNLIIVYTLTPEEIIKEKIETYLKRIKARDLYDIFFLLRYVKDKRRIKKELRRLVNKFDKLGMPVDKEELKILIIEGLIPDVEEMLQYIKSFV